MTYEELVDDFVARNADVRATKMGRRPERAEQRVVLARRSGVAVRGRRRLMGEILERPGRRAEVKVSRDEIVAFEFEMAPEKDGAGPFTAT